MPFVMQFYGAPFSYLWEDQDGVVHPISQAEGGEQGDPLMPALFSLGAHPALQALQAQLQEDERLFILGRRLRCVFAGLFIHSAIRVHHGKTQVWNRGVVPSGIEVVEAVARITDPEAIVWRGDTALRPVAIFICDTRPVVAKVPTLPDLQCAWMVLLCTQS